MFLFSLINDVGQQDVLEEVREIKKILRDRQDMIGSGMHIQIVVLSFSSCILFILHKSFQILFLHA